MLICGVICNVSNLKCLRDNFFLKEREINLRDYEDQAGKKNSPMRGMKTRYLHTSFLILPC